MNTKEIIPEFTVDNKYTKNPIHITLDKKEQWYMMGYYVRNGWLQSETCHDINFTILDYLNSDNTTHIYVGGSKTLQKYEDEIMDKIGSVLPITFQMHNTEKFTVIGSYNNFPSDCCKNFTWYSILTEFGKDKCGKIIPEWVHDAPKEYIQEFIDGYVKSDHCLITDSFDIAFSIQRLFIKLNKIYSITITPELKKDNIKFSLYIHPYK